MTNKSNYEYLLSDLTNLKGVEDPEQKRKIIGRTFIDIFDNEAAKLKDDVNFLAQGTIYPDVIESSGSESKEARVIKSNNAGGILGGISSGQEIVISFAVKPTSSILTSRKTIDKFGKNTSISVKGRHDPCVGIRAVPIGEAMMHCVLLDHYLMNIAQCKS